MGFLECGGVKAAAGHSRPSDLEYVHRHFLGVALGHFGFDQILDGGDLVRDLLGKCFQLLQLADLAAHFINAHFVFLHKF